MAAETAALLGEGCEKVGDSYGGEDIEKQKYKDVYPRARVMRCDGLAFYTLLFFFGSFFGMAMFPLIVTLISQQPHNETPKKSDSDVGIGETAGNAGLQKPVLFSEIAGMDEAKKELAEVVEFLKNPSRFEEIGARMPKGVLLAGPPGSGKTMMARAVATEAGVPYLYASGPEFVEIYVGQGAKRIRELFASARKKAPCIVFLDEIDAVGGKRQSHGGGGGQREHDHTLNQLLVDLDGFRSSSGIVVIGATNRVEILDEALLRPGRFDRIVHVPLPDVAGRDLILRKYLGQVKHSDDVDIKLVARLTSGFSGAELENLVNEAAILAARVGKQKVGKLELSEARDKISMGPAMRSVVMSEEQKKTIAYHEAGHALVAYFLAPHTDPVHKATIISRGSVLGFVEQLPPDNRHGHAFIQLRARLAVSMGGRVAEALIFGPDNISNNASSDIANATSLAYRMVTEWGMSEKLGPLNYTRGIARQALGTKTAPLSDSSANLVETEVKRLIFEAQQVAEKILRKHKSLLDKVAHTLLQQETLTGQQIHQLITTP